MHDKGKVAKTKTAMTEDTVEPVRQPLRGNIEGVLEHPPGYSVFAIPTDLVVCHNQSRIIQGAGLSVTTPAARWAYAAEFPIHRIAGQLPAGRIIVRVEARVEVGSVGIGCIGEDGQYIVEIEVSPRSPSPYIDLLIDKAQSLRSVVVRNTSELSNPSRIAVAGITILASDEMEAEDATIAIDELVPLPA